jgi:sugar (pentulose or hexulose) kinase
MGLYLKDPEITPRISCTGQFFRFQKGKLSSEPSETFTDPAAEVRAAVEGRLLSMKLHAGRIGILKPRQLIATGGGSKNTQILQIMADVFGLDVYVEQQSDAASFGAALRAVQALRSVEQGHVVPFDQACKGAFRKVIAAKPNMQAHYLYMSMLPSYEKAESLVVDRCTDTLTPQTDRT